MIRAWKIWNFFDIIMTNVSYIRECIRERKGDDGKEGMVNKLRNIKTGETLKVKH